MERDALLTELLAQVTALREDMIAAEARLDRAIGEVPPGQRASARNLVHYVALRQRDARALQDGLASLGLSSLGRAEAHVLPTVDAALHSLHSLGTGAPSRPPDLIGISSSQRRLAGRAEALLGRAATGRDVRIMVTMPSEAAREYELVRDLLVGGMDSLLRQLRSWSSDAATVQRAPEESGRPPGLAPAAV